MIPLTVRSHYSLMWGTASVKQLCRAAKRQGYQRLALTDTDNLYGLWPFLNACRHEGLTPIIGAEMTDPRTRQRAVCLVENDRGYRNLCRLITRRHTHPDFCLKADLPPYAGGLTVLTKDPALVAAWCEGAVTVAAAMPRHPLAALHPLRQAAKRYNVPLVATPGSFFLDPGDWILHRMLRAIAHNTTLAHLTPAEVAPENAWLASSRIYRKRFAVCPETLETTYLLAERLTFRGPDFGIVMPPLDKRLRTEKRGAVPQGGRADALLRKKAYAGARKRYGRELSEPVVERLEMELRVITAMGFGAYFLIVKEIVARSPRICGRGSAAASLVAYCLEITNVCPLKHNLYFDRFLNLGRKDPPDIDVDFAWDERDAILNGVLARHQGHAAMVCNHVTFKPRMAVREVAKVYGLPEGEINEVTRTLPWFWHLNETDAELMTQLKNRPESKTLDFAPPWPEILDLAMRLIGIPRYLSVHPGGVVITPDPIETYVPVQAAPKGVPIIQWEKDGAEEGGLVKIDLLGNRSLGVIRDAVANVHQNGIAFDEYHWVPEDDYSTQEAVGQGRTMGCFYIESPAMRLLQQKAGVGDFEHLVIHSSIIRPAANEYIREYIRRLHGGAWEPIHPLLTDVLDETFGIMVYQEDVSRVAVALAGFSSVQADGLRKILSKKDREYRLGDWKDRFFKGARDKGLSEAQIIAVWDMMMSFSGYSFCKPHSASYARVSFQAAYLKTHYPAEFMAAVISNQGGFYSTFAYVSEARRMQVRVLSPDVNVSELAWKGRDREMRVGLMALKGLALAARYRIVAERQKAPFRDLDDFFSRIQPDEAEARALVHSGALDAFSPHHNRAELMWAFACRVKRKANRAVTQSLFKTQTVSPIPQLPPENPTIRLKQELAVLGFLCDRHPITLYDKIIRRLGTVKVGDVPRFIGRTIRIAGWLITGKVVHTKQGQTMEFLTFEDETGIIETTFFPEAYRRFCHMIDRGCPYLLAGKVEQDWGAITLTVEHVRVLK